MAEMAEKPPVKAPKFRRFDLWIQYKEDGLTNAETALRMGLSERQLQRHILQWKEDGTLDNYYLSEWVITKAALRDNDDLKPVFQELTKLILKRMKEQLEVQGDVRIDLAWEKEESQSNIALTVDNNPSTNQQPDSASSPADADSAKQSQAQTKPSNKPSYAA